MKLHRNSMKTMLMLPMLSVLTTSAITHYKYASQAFDDLTDHLPSIDADRDRQQIVNTCMLGDYVMNTKALMAEVDYCKAPTDYIYSTLV